MSDVFIHALFDSNTAAVYYIVMLFVENEAIGDIRNACASALDLLWSRNHSFKRSQ